MQKNLFSGATALHRCEDQYEYELERARLHLSELGQDQSLLAELLATINAFVADHGTEDLRHFLYLLRRQLEASSHSRIAGLIAHYLDYGMEDDPVSHCTFPEMRLAALSVPRQSSRAATVVVRRARR